MPSNPLALKYSDFPSTKKHYPQYSHESGLFFAAPPELADWFHQKYSLEGLPPTDKRYPTIVNPHTGLRHFSRDCPVPTTLTLSLAKKWDDIYQHWDMAWAAFEELYIETIPEPWVRDPWAENSVFFNEIASVSQSRREGRVHLPERPGHSSIEWDRNLQSELGFQGESTDYFGFVEIPFNAIAPQITMYQSLIRNKPLCFDHMQRRAYQRNAGKVGSWRRIYWQLEYYQELLSRANIADRFKLIINQVAKYRWSFFYTGTYYFDWRAAWCEGAEQ